MKTNTNIGVLVGRFQTPELHEAHIQLIQEVAGRHQKVLIFLGVSPVPVTRRNPLDFPTRMLMIKKFFPDIVVLPLMDMASDDAWSHQLNEKIREAFPIGTCTLYGGRDSFISHYKGHWPCEELETKIIVSSTDIRSRCSNDVKSSSDFRAGVVYAAYNQYPRTVPCVDIGIYRPMEDHFEMLLGRKPGETGWRFVGGHVDPTDASLETAARREAMEETGVEVAGFEYVTSRMLNDWRYRNEVDKIMTTLFAALYVYGRVEPGDDIAELRWAPAHDAELGTLEIVSVHQDLMKVFIEHLRKKEGKNVKSVTANG
jgi:bifunctional NMN adenylyltransferase/nudix hydrolase